jgi:putative metallohydrolase (TIGR04338 family)
MSRDFQRAKLYSAENRLAWMMDHTLRAELDGVSLQLEPERRFVDLVDIRCYVNRIVLHPGVIGRFGTVGPVTVRERKGGTKAHYEAATRTIAINTSGTRWAMRELVVLHELAHHYAPGDSHGPTFTAALHDLVEIVIGPQTALALQILYRNERVK